MEKFDLGDILSITTGRMLSPSGMDGIYKILDYMEGISHSTMGLGAAAERCLPLLLEKYPQLSKENLKEDIEKLDQQMSKEGSGDIKKNLINNWRDELKQKFGETLDVPKANEINDLFNKIKKIRGTDNQNSDLKNKP